LEAPAPAYRDLIAPGKYQSQIVRVHGQVTFLDPGRGFFLDMSDPVDWKRALWVDTSETSRLRLGQWVDAVGQVDVFSFELALRDALVRPLESGPAPVPARLQADRLANIDCQGKLVILDAKLIEMQSTVDEDIWVFSAGNGVAYAKLPAAAGRLPHFAKDSRVQICGIALRHRAPGFDAPPKPFAYQIWMRGPDDGRLLSAPSWWTPRRIQWLIAGLLVLAAAVAIWNSLLHGKVRTQTEIIRRHMATQTIHQERARIARDLHDEIGSNLGSLTLLTQIAQEEFKDDENARREFGEMHRIARKTYDSLRDIVWLTASDSPDPKVLEHRLRETAEMMLSSIQHTVSLNLAALPRELPLEFARHVLLIFKEALHNAVRHADATLITVTALASPARLSLRISDNGRGFDPAKVTESAGLPSVRERAHLLRAELQIRSAPGAGAEFILNAPLAAAT
jgi:signal transduction histidine kinase